MAIFSEAPDTPKTPGPLFAFRAIKNMFAGSPDSAAEDESAAPIKSLNTGGFKRSDDILEQAAQARSRLDPPQLTKPQPSADANGSPTKGILWTPGTTSKFRKTVSFGSGVKDNEPKKPLFADQMKQENRPMNNKAMPSASNVVRNSGGLFDDLEAQDQFEFLQLDEDDDVTTDLTRPHSQSGNFWKKEYEDFKAKTMIETRRLVEYRSAAKEFAKRQAMETQLLKKQRHGKDATISDLRTQLRAAQILSVQRDDTSYKREIEALHLRQLQDQAELRKKDAELEEMARQLEEAKSLAPTETRSAAASVDDDEAEAMRSAVESSEQKAKELRTENSTLKRMLARVKAEISNYEVRRKAKEERLKARESKMEERLQRYRQELRNTKQQLAEEQERFREEQQEMKTMIEVLRTKLSIAMPADTELTEDLDQSMKNYRDRRANGNIPVNTFDAHQPRQTEDDSIELVNPPDQSAELTGDDDEGRQDDRGGTPDTSPSKGLAGPPLDVVQTPRTSMMNRKANPRRFARLPTSPGVSLTPQGPASAKKAAMSSQRIYAAEARLRLRGRRGV
ncbi:hypothetical protein KEM56_000293 [Ascosphaera pollenicola]|nr:hypothetical protein KEM56_000293 [Ascosphaera pollenicola]